MILAIFISALLGELLRMPSHWWTMVQIRSTFRSVSRNGSDQCLLGVHMRRKTRIIWCLTYININSLKTVLIFCIFFTNPADRVERRQLRLRDDCWRRKLSFRLQLGHKFVQLRTVPDQGDLLHWLLRIPLCPHQRYCTKTQPNSYHVIIPIVWRHSYCCCFFSSFLSEFCVELPPVRAPLVQTHCQNRLT